MKDTDRSLVALVAVRGADGSIDQEATLDRVASLVEEYAALESADTEQVALAVNAVFDGQPKGSSLALGNVAAMAALSMTKDTSTFGAIKERAENFLRTSPEFNVALGKGGGVTRLADLPADRAAALVAATAARHEKAAAKKAAKGQ